MIIDFKLENAKYVIRPEGASITVDCIKKYIKDGVEKSITSILGHYGPGQHQHAINRIIAEEITLDEERVNLRQFLQAYKKIHESINEQMALLTEELKANRK